MNDPRYDILDASNETNRLDEIGAGISFVVGKHTPIVAIVDEEEGIIAYAIEPFAPEIVLALNGRV